MDEYLEIIRVPKHGLKLKLNHQYPEKWSPTISRLIKYIWALFPLIIRLIIEYVVNEWFGNGYFVSLRQEIGQQIYGVPIGGIGGGSIGRGFRGEFCRYQLKPGSYEYQTVDANQFIVTIRNTSGETTFQSALSTFKTSGKLKSWQWLLDGDKCYYTGLYPRAWTEYDLSEHGIKLICRQISPVIPHNYKDSSLPCAVFVWEVENLTKEDKNVTITFTFKNGTRNQYVKKLCNAKSFTFKESSGVVLYNMIENVPCAYALVSKQRDDVSLSKCLHFNPNSNGEAVWNQLLNNGQFDKLKDRESDLTCDDMACGLALNTSIAAKEKKTLEFCLTWDMPIVTFPGSNKSYKRFYTKHFGDSNAFLRIGEYALRSYGRWEKEIHEWQKPVLEDPDLPNWYKTALFNETYYISDGGTIWFVMEEASDVAKSKFDPRSEYGQFAYLEGHEYGLFNSYDVHFYASFALAMNWPYIQLCIQYDMKDFIAMEIPQSKKFCYDGSVHARKVKNSIPHDFGDISGSPFVLINSYPFHDVSEWRDLNAYFVLQVFRDYCLMVNVNNFQRKQYLRDMFDTCHKIMCKSMNFDIDHDCLIENSGEPDQTFDIWVMNGSSAYCGGLWLAALFAMVEIGEALNRVKIVKCYKTILDKAKTAFEEKLWNGKYYNFDCSDQRSIVMASQLCGHWYLRACGYQHEVFPKSQVVSSLNVIFENNVKLFCNGNRGAVNGFKIDKGVVYTCLQSEEAWIGITYALAASMLQEKLYSKAWRTAGKMYKTMVEKAGLAFQTPEAITEFNSYRALGYMRPLSIWSMQLAWEQQKQ